MQWNENNPTQVVKTGDKLVSIDFVPDLDELAEICQFKSEVLPGFDEHWLCRHNDCRLIVMPGDWVHNKPGGGHFRCPSCGRPYAPWKPSGGLCRANKICMFQLTDKTLEYILIFWPDTTLENLLTKFKQIMDPELKEIKKLKPEDRLPYILRHIEDTAETRKPLYMKNFPFTEKVQKLIDEKNSTGKEARFDYEHVKANGYNSKKVDEDVNLDEPLEQEDLLRAWGFVKVMIMMVRKGAPAGSSGADQRGQ